MFVVVSKLNSEANAEPAAHLPADWPAETKEFETAEAAKEAFPDRKVYTLDEYKLFSDGLSLAFETHRPPKKRWWKWWSK